MILAMREAREARTVGLEQAGERRKVELAEFKERRRHGLIARHAAKLARLRARQA